MKVNKQRKLKAKLRDEKCRNCDLSLDVVMGNRDIVERMYCVEHEHLVKSNNWCKKYRVRRKDFQ